MRPSQAHGAHCWAKGPKYYAARRNWYNSTQQHDGCCRGRSWTRPTPSFRWVVLLPGATGAPVLHGLGRNGAAIAALGAHCREIWRKRPHALARLWPAIGERFFISYLPRPIRKRAGIAAVFAASAARPDAGRPPRGAAAPTPRIGPRHTKLPLLGPRSPVLRPMSPHAGRHKLVPLSGACRTGALWRGRGSLQVQLRGGVDLPV